MDDLSVRFLSPEKHFICEWINVDAIYASKPLVIGLVFGHTGDFTQMFSATALNFKDTV